MDEIDIAYIAGLFDGEGNICIGVHRVKRERHYILPSHSLQCSISNGNKEVLDWIQEMYGGYVSTSTYSDKKKNWDDCYTWRVHSNSACTFLSLIQPYLRIKQKQAELAIIFHTERKDIRNMPMDFKLKELNRREYYRREIGKLNQGNIKLIGPIKHIYNEVI